MTFLSHREPSAWLRHLPATTPACSLQTCIVPSWAHCSIVLSLSLYSCAPTGSNQVWLLLYVACDIAWQHCHFSVKVSFCMCGMLHNMACIFTPTSGSKNSMWCLHLGMTPLARAYAAWRRRQACACAGLRASSLAFVHYSMPHCSLPAALHASLSPRGLLKTTTTQAVARWTEDRLDETSG